MGDLEKLLGEFERNAGASEVAIAECERHFGLKLPKDYRNFMVFSNGGEGFIGANSYLRLWKIEELPLMNDGYETAKYLPNGLLFGTDGGEEAFGFDLRTSQIKIVQVPFIGMEWKYAWLLSDSFNGFLHQLYEAQM
jgi:hypothetical protein